jgi:hypothetical protein
MPAGFETGIHFFIAGKYHYHYKGQHVPLIIFYYQVIIEWHG